MWHCRLSITFSYIVSDLFISRHANETPIQEEEKINNLSH